MQFTVRQHIHRVYRIAPGAILAALLLLSSPMDSLGQGQVVVDSLAVGMKAPTFVMKKLGTTDYVFMRDYVGELRQEARFRGATQKVIILSFFASWCKPCQKEAPVLASIAKDYEDQDVQLFYVNWGDSDTVTREWIAEHGAEGTVLMDPYGNTAKKYGVNSLPRTIIIDKEGTVRLIEAGFSEENEQHYREQVIGTLENLIRP